MFWHKTFTYGSWIKVAATNLDASFISFHRGLNGVRMARWGLGWSDVCTEPDRTGSTSEPCPLNRFICWTEPRTKLNHACTLSHGRDERRTYGMFAARFSPTTQSPLAGPLYWPYFPSLSFFFTFQKSIDSAEAYFRLYLAMMILVLLRLCVRI